MTFLLETLRLGLANLFLHKLRSLLTALGIICGVFAVILMVAIGEGNKQAALARIRQLGANNIILRSVKPPESNSVGESRQRLIAYGLKRIDLRRIQALLPRLDAAAPLKEVGAIVQRDSLRSTAAVYGVVPNLIDITSLRLQRGRYLNQADLDARSHVVVLGAEVADRLFPLADPLGGVVQVGDRPHKVVGVLRPVGLAGGAGSALVGRDLNFDLHIPLTSAEAEWGDMVVKRSSGSFDGRIVELSEVYLRVRDGDDVLETGRQVRDILALEHPDLSDVEVIIPLELLEQEKSTRLMQNALLISIACISLLVGGIGIMNIMLASVTERTREIGIRRAVGATRAHILLQFLIETTTLSGLGGLIGVALGLGGAALVGLIHHRIEGIEQPQVTLWSIAVSFAVATSVGIVFGLYPARQAALQDPIHALRHD